jgi:hypothetical protein
MSTSSSAARAAKLAAKYGPHAVAAAKVVGPAAKEAVETQRKRMQHRHAAFDKARTLAAGSVLRQREGDEVVFVVFAGDEPVAAYPEVTTPLAALVEKADLSQRMTPEQYDAAKVSARAGRAAKKIAARAKSSKDEPKQLGS